MHDLWLTLTQDLPAQAPSPGAETGEVVVFLVFALFALLFAAVGWAFLRKKRRERIEVLEKASEEAAREIEGQVPGAGPAELPARAAEGVEKVTARADDLVRAEREAQKARVAEDRARRERERLEREAAAAAEAEDEARKAAEEKLARARQAEADAKKAADEAQAKAKQLSNALKATREGFIGRISKVVGAGKVDDSVLEDLEAVLFTADIGARTAERMLSAVRERLKGKDIADASRVQAVLKDEARTILSSVDVKPLNLDAHKPSVVMILGVNGAGKTTSIGKLAAQLKSQGRSVLLGAGDTFRAAASEQLEVWGQRADAPVVSSDKEGADPSSVLFDAVKQAEKDGIDVVLCDTAGRLHTKVNLMEELKKVTRVLGKARAGAPDEVLLVLDATVGQNAIQQARQFGEAAPITGIVLTKLDGTAKGGVILGIADELKIPVRYIGVGETIGDLRPFDPDAFVDALFGEHAAPRPPTEEAQPCAPA